MAIRVASRRQRMSLRQEGSFELEISASQKWVAFANARLVITFRLFDVFPHDEVDEMAVFGVPNFDRCGRGRALRSPPKAGKTSKVKDEGSEKVRRGDEVRGYIKLRKGG